MTRQRTEVYIATTVSRAPEARELLNSLRDQLTFDRPYTGAIETWRPATPLPPDAPTQLVMYLTGDVKEKIESRLAAMDAAFEVKVEVWEESSS